MRFALPLIAACAALASCTTGAEHVQVAAEPGQASIETIPPAELAEMVAGGKVVLIDVRTPEEFAQMRIPGGLLSPLDTFDPAAIPQEQLRETILYCRSSRRSAAAAQLLADYLGKPVRHLEGGIMAWQEAGLDLIVSEPAGA